MTNLGPSAPGLDMDTLIEQAKPKLLDLLTDKIDGDVSAEKTWQYLQAREGLEYWRGNQFGSPAFINNEIRYMADPLDPYGNLPNDNSGDDEIFDDTFNVYRGDGKKFVSLIAAKTPNTKAVADNPEDMDSELASRKADTAIRALRSQIEESRITKRLGKGLWCTGTQFGHTFWEADGNKYGWTQEPKYELQPQVVKEAGYTCTVCGTEVPEGQSQGSNPTPPQAPLALTAGGAAGLEPGPASPLSQQMGGEPPVIPPPPPVNPADQMPAPPIDELGNDITGPPTPEEIGQQIGQEASDVQSGPGEPPPPPLPPQLPPQPSPIPPSPLTGPMDPLGHSLPHGAIEGSAAPASPLPIDPYAPPAITCPNCGANLPPETFSPEQTAQVPTQTGTTKYPKGQVRLEVYNSTHVTTPPDTKDLESCLWLRLESEEHRADMFAQYPQIAEKFNEGADSNRTVDQSQGALIRRVESSWGPLQERANRVTRSIYWLSSKIFKLLAIESPDIAKGLEEAFPKGLRITRIAGELVDPKHERLCERWSVCLPDISETIWADPHGKDFIPYQNFINHVGNLTQETLLRGIPQSVGDPQIINFELMRRRTNRPGEIHPAMTGSAGQLKDAIRELPKAELSEYATPAAAASLTMGRENVGMTPAVWGGEGASQTAREAEQKKNQGLQVLNIPWDEIRQFWCVTDRNMVKIFAEFGDKAISPGKVSFGLTGGYSDAIDAATLTMDGWHVEAEEAFPMTWGQRRDAVQMAFAAGPDNPMIQVLGLAHPFNAMMLSDLFGFTGQYIPGVDLQRYVMRRITQLLQSGPVPSTDPMTGMTTFMASVQPDEFVEKDFATMAEFYRAWCMSPAGERSQRDNEQGFENVRAYGMWFDQQLMIQQAQQAAAMAQQGNQPPPPKGKGAPASNPSPGVSGGDNGPAGAGNVVGGQPGSTFPPPLSVGVAGDTGGNQPPPPSPAGALPVGLAGITMPPGALPNGGLPVNRPPLG